ncbi:MAG TPA: hypothetical protein VJL31_13085 [Gemmatimonadales bacterium]|nr:hypothetical protein [Gemmatimonadales bacterium]
MKHLPRLPLGPRNPDALLHAIEALRCAFTWLLASYPSPPPGQTVREIGARW